MMTKSHYFFILPASPWPLMSSLGSMNCFMSLLIFFKYNLEELFMLSLLFTTISSFMWWNFYSEEFNKEGWVSLNLESGLKFSMILFISSEVFFFFSFFWSYFHFFFAPMVELGLSWPPKSLMFFDFLNVPLINTLVLLSSGVTVTLSHHHLMKGSKSKFLWFLFCTILMGMFFSALQVLEYNSSFFSISDSTFGTSFFMLTGFHGLHVLIGSMYLFSILCYSMSFKTSKSSSLGFELASWYWHFVDVVWMFLYFSIYYLNS